MAESYSRIYHRLMTEYPSVWRDPAKLGLYVQLLVTAEKFYPQSAPIPRGNRHFRALVGHGLVIDQGDGCYSILGLGAERERRATHGRTGAVVRWDRERNATAMLDETRRDKKETSNGQSPPQTFIGWPSKPKPGSHEGQHPSCLVCEGMRTRWESEGMK